MLWVSPNPGGRCRSSLRHWFANGAFVLTRYPVTHQDGGVAGASPAEGGVPAISAPARGKAFPHPHLGLPGLVRAADMVDETDQDIGLMRWWRDCHIQCPDIS